MKFRDQLSICVTCMAGGAVLSTLALTYASRAEIREIKANCHRETLDLKTQLYQERVRRFDSEAPLPN